MPVSDIDYGFGAEQLDCYGSGSYGNDGSLYGSVSYVYLSDADYGQGFGLELLLPFLLLDHDLGLGLDSGFLVKRSSDSASGKEYLGPVELAIADSGVLAELSLFVRATSADTGSGLGLDGVILVESSAERASATESSGLMMPVPADSGALADTFMPVMIPCADAGTGLDGCSVNAFIYSFSAGVGIEFNSSTASVLSFQVFPRVDVSLSVVSSASLVLVVAKSR